MATHLWVSDNSRYCSLKQFMTACISWASGFDIAGCVVRNRKSNAPGLKRQKSVTTLLCCIDPPALSLTRELGRHFGKRKALYNQGSFHRLHACFANGGNKFRLVAVVVLFRHLPKIIATVFSRVAVRLGPSSQSKGFCDGVAIQFEQQMHLVALHCPLRMGVSGASYDDASIWPRLQ